MQLPLDQFANNKIPKKKTRMFNIVTRTWNPITGCYHNCIYCWARKLAQRLRNSNPKYKGGFKHAFHETEFNKKFKPGEFVFVVDMGDLFGDWVPRKWIEKIIDHISKFPRTEFLFLTKNPKRYLEFEFPKNAWLGATIETDRDELYIKYKISAAPLPSERYKVMRSIKWEKKFIAIEPILDFTDNFIQWIKEINPKIIYVGYDNYNSKLPEPPLEKTEELIRELKSQGFYVFEKTIREAWYQNFIDDIEDPLCYFYRIVHQTPIVINNQRAKLIDYGKILLDILSNNERKIIKPFITKHPGTIFKLYFIWAYIRIYREYMRHLKMKWSKKYEGAEVYYIDLFSGGGLTEVNIKNKRVMLPGSAIFPLLAQQRMYMSQKFLLFDKIILNDKDPSAIESLKLIVKKSLNLLGLDDAYSIRICPNEKACDQVLNRSFTNIGRREIIICKLDANILAKEIVKKLTERNKARNIWINAFVFADPSSPFQFKFPSLQSILQIPGDIFMLVHLNEIPHMISKWRKHKGKNKLLKHVEDTYADKELINKILCGEIDPTTAYLLKMEEIAEKTRIMFLADNRLPIHIPIRTRQNKYYLVSFIRRKFADNYQKLKNKKEVPSELKWIDFLIKQKMVFEKVSNLGDRVVEMLEGKFVTLFGKPCKDFPLNYWFR